MSKHVIFGRARSFPGLMLVPLMRYQLWGALQLLGDVSPSGQRSGVPSTVYTLRTVGGVRRILLGPGGVPLIWSLRLLLWSSLLPVLLWLLVCRVSLDLGRNSESAIYLLFTYLSVHCSLQFSAFWVWCYFLIIVFYFDSLVFFSTHLLLFTVSTTFFFFFVSLL